MTDLCPVPGCGGLRKGLAFCGPCYCSLPEELRRAIYSAKFGEMDAPIEAAKQWLIKESEEFKRKAAGA